MRFDAGRLSQWHAAQFDGGRYPNVGALLPLLLIVKTKLQLEVLMRRNTVHGFAPRKNSHPVYRIWKGMNQRCYNPHNKQWEDYGGRGIVVCDRWREFANFFDDMGASYRAGLTIERKDNNGNYEPLNCTWVTRKVQNNNKRNLRRITFKGKTLTATEWSKAIGGNPHIVSVRLGRGWSPERAVSTPAGAVGSNQAGMIPK